MNTTDPIVICVAAADGYYKADGAIAACPAGTWSEPGASASTECRSGTSPPPSWTYVHSKSTSDGCEAGSLADVGCTAGCVDDGMCGCPSGMAYVYEDGLCEVCPAGSYVGPADLTCQMCPEHSSSLQGAAASDECVCDDGYIPKQGAPGCEVPDLLYVSVRGANHEHLRGAYALVVASAGGDAELLHGRPLYKQLTSDTVTGVFLGWARPQQAEDGGEWAFFESARSLCPVRKQR